MYRLTEVAWSLIGCMSLLLISIPNDIPFKQHLTCSYTHLLDWHNETGSSYGER